MSPVSPTITSHMTTVGHRLKIKLKKKKEKKKGNVLFKKHVCDGVNLDTCAFPCEGGYSDKVAKGRYVSEPGCVRAVLPSCVCESVLI